ncbi:MAG: MarR family transcriptional regulator [Chloroflexota bacterium]|nr:MarR family transcriptional regulator [Chloroflexota bacterium]
MTTSHDTLIDQAVVQINALAAHRRRAICAEPRRRQVSMPQVYILMTLQERGAMTVSELAHLLSVSAPSASSILDRMEEHGLIERVRDAIDRRVVHVGITEPGSRLMEEVMGLKREQMQRLLDSMTDRELEHVVEGAAAVERALRRARETAEAPAGTTV